ncbi:chaperonin 10-like protein [Fusarium oxysporum Fo47]|uniref:alcohol dehydrogenase n=1 Tax=Fusarium oxysporum Fo47 TaxID=660027 RepID=W9JPN8_FUSOX|nr:chaperonin 10-like protein [Fusarium oxysporum Fo47]EWZ34042.1 alcohol dehydrogenase 1 [Fusarium oxysporum Fo47]QKD63147.1 chaperonin 10-like protein [Fusarium oxysporum Fo47]
MPVIEIPKEQWAQVLEKPGGLVVHKKVPVHMPGPDEVLVNVKYSGVCHTDLHAMMGDWPLKRKMPLVGGHEGAGVVVAKGELVMNIEISDHVGIKWLNGSCLNCTFCLQGDEQLCPQALLSGYTVDGTFQQYAIAKAAHITRIPSECSLEDVCPILCAGLTVYKGLKESGVRPGQYVAIVGAGGGLGCVALQYAKAMGVHSIAIDAGNDKSKVCKDLGAAAFIDFQESSDIAADVRAAVPDGFGPHAVLVLATHEVPFQQAYKYVRSHGSVVCIGMPGYAYLKAPIFATVVRMVNIKGSYVGNRQDAAEAIEFFRLGQIKAPHKLIGLSHLQDVYDMMLKDEIVGRYVVDTSK